jgi:hypothetical protein
MTNKLITFLLISILFLLGVYVGTKISNREDCNIVGKIEAGWELQSQFRFHRLSQAENDMKIMKLQQVLIQYDNCYNMNVDCTDKANKLIEQAKALEEANNKDENIIQTMIQTGNIL